MDYLLKYLLITSRLQSTVKPSTCSDMKRLGESADGEYRLYPHIFGGQATFVYCHNMHHAVPQEYVTLQFLNGQQYEPTGDCSGKGYWISGATYFNKIRVNIDVSTTIGTSHARVDQRHWFHGVVVWKEGRKEGKKEGRECFYLTTHSAHFNTVI